MGMSDMERIQQAAYRYAQGCDRLNAELLASSVHPEWTMTVKGLPPMGGPEQAAQTVAMLDEMFELTRHEVYQCHYTITDDVAVGECYCRAAHLLKERRDGKGVIDEWAIRYQDRLERRDGDWRFIHRELLIDWKEDRLVNIE